MSDRITIKLKNRPLYFNMRRGAPRNFFKSVGAVKKDEAEKIERVNAQYSSSTFVTRSNLSVELLGEDAARLFLMIQNNDAANNCWLAFGSPADQTGFILPPLGTLIIDRFAPSNQINVFSTVAVSLTVVEGK